MHKMTVCSGSSFCWAVVIHSLKPPSPLLPTLWLDLTLWQMELCALNCGYYWKWLGSETWNGLLPFNLIFRCLGEHWTKVNQIVWTILRTPGPLLARVLSRRQKIHLTQVRPYRTQNSGMIAPSEKLQIQNSKLSQFEGHINILTPIF
jgi:hypothetical protein